MVLVSYILDENISILQTEFSHREGHEARRGVLEAMPLDQHIKDGHRAREPRLQIRPHPVHDFPLNFSQFVGVKNGMNM